MRIYTSGTIKEELLTGFQSPCSEFAEKPLSFDERYGLGDPGIRLIKVESDFPQLGVMKGDHVLVDLGETPGPNSLVVTFMDDEVRLFKGNKLSNLDDLVCGVITVIIRDFYSE
jgi:hypothetical protein